MTPGIYAPTHACMHNLPASRRLPEELDYAFWRSMALDIAPTFTHVKGSKP